MSDENSIIKFRPAQIEFVKGVDRHGVVAFLARRQFGKTTILSAIALKKMMKRKDHTVVFGSVKLNLSREIVRKEAEIMRRAIASLQAEATDASGMLTTVDTTTGRDLGKLRDDDYAEMFEQQRLEFRYYHTRQSYSRTKVVALLPDTVGETGDLICDEISRSKQWAETWEAIEPIVQSNPDYRLLLATTPSPDDSHLSNQMLCPPVGTPLPLNPKGNWYRSEYGFWVLRVDAFDAYAGGVPVYDLETREPLDPAEHRRRAMDKDAWDRNYGIKFILGGTSAIGVVQLQCAQTRGIDQCKFIMVDEESDLQEAIAWLRLHLGPNPVGMGVDLATTEKEASNPTSFAVVELDGTDVIFRLVAAWKTRDPDLARHRIKSLVTAVNSRTYGPRARRLAIDATNERYFSKDVQTALAGLVPVELVIASETVELTGQEPITKKALLGNQFVDVLDRNVAWLPPERYLKEDLRRVKRDRGSFNAELGPNGEHGDTFDACKLALHALHSTSSGVVTAETLKQISMGANSLNGPTFIPRRLV